MPFFGRGEQLTSLFSLRNQFFLSFFLLTHGVVFLNLPVVLYLLVGYSIHQRRENLSTHIVGWRLLILPFFFPLHSDGFIGATSFSLGWKQVRI